jgi:hypothetical protein
MDIRFIAFGMIIILLALFIGVHFYLPKEKKKSKWEIEYAIAAQAYYNDQTKENFEVCYSVLLNWIGDNTALIEKKLNQDKIIKP